MSSSGSAPSKAAMFAKRRLVRDLKELQREYESLQTVSALPTANIFEWRCNIRPDEGPYAGTIFHLVLNFDDTYPHTPPKVYLCTFLDHPNVFGAADYFNWEHPFICLDMLQEYYTDEPYVGWTSAYSVMSLLLQLQSFFFAENIPQNYGADSVEASKSVRSISRAIREAWEFSCSIDTCDGEASHSQQGPWPHLPVYTGKMSAFRGLAFKSSRDLQAADSKVVLSYHDDLSEEPSQIAQSFELASADFPVIDESCTGVCAAKSVPRINQARSSQGRRTITEEAHTENVLLPDLPSFILAHLFSFLHYPEMLRVRNVCKYWRTVVLSFNMFERPQMMCYHSKANIDEPGCVLGIGLNVQYYRDGNLKSATSPLDMLSLQAFREEDVRKGVWGGREDRFDNFLPLIIDNAHAEKVVPLIEQAVFHVMKRVPFLPTHYFRSIARPRPVAFKPTMILQLLAVLMNTMVVELMESASTQRSQRHRRRNNQGRLHTPDEQKIGRHASEKALEGYCAFHHMLLYFASQYPSIQNMASRQVDKFINCERTRHKRSTPNLGLLLVSLALSKKTSWEDMWRPLLLETFDRNVRWLLQKYPELADVETLGDDERLEKTFLGARTSLRLLMFQVHFMRSIGRPAGMDRGDVLARYEQRMGKPSTAQKEDLQAACRAILRVNNWPEFFERLYAPVPTKERLVEVLRNAVANSERKRYHKR